MKRIIALSLLILSTPAPAQERFTAEQLDARSPYDLGPKEVDVTSYPKEQQENYKTFAKACSQCHTPARALNSPLVGRENWRRYIKRMYQRTKSNAGTALGKEDAEAVIDFLTYDSHIRKVQKKAAFAAEARELKALFADVRRERSRVQVESDRKKVKEGGK